MWNVTQQHRVLQNFVAEERTNFSSVEYKTKSFYHLQKQWQLFCTLSINLAMLNIIHLHQRWHIGFPIYRISVNIGIFSNIGYRIGWKLQALKYRISDIGRFENIGYRLNQLKWLTDIRYFKCDIPTLKCENKNPRNQCKRCPRDVTKAQMHCFPCFTPLLNELRLQLGVNWVIHDPIVP